MIDWRIFTEAVWSVDEVTIPPAEPWIYKLGKYRFELSPQLHSINPVGWIFEFPELGLDFYWIVPPHDAWLGMLGDAVFDFTFAATEFQRKMVFAESGKLREEVRVAFRKRKLKSVFYPEFQVRINQPWVGIKFWAGSRSRERVVELFSALNDKLGESAFFHSRDVLPIFDFYQDVLQVLPLDIGKLQYVKNNFTFDLVEFDILCAFSRARSSGIDRTIAWDCGRLDQVSACHRLLTIDADVLRSAITPSIRLLSGSVWFVRQNDEFDYVVDELSILRAELTLHISDIFLLAPVIMGLVVVEKAFSGGWPVKQIDGGLEKLRYLLNEAYVSIIFRFPEVVLIGKIFDEDDGC